MMKRDGAADKIRLPLQQTVFLPKNAMGVRYIDKVRTAVFVEKVSAGDGGLWLRGFWELDLEYQGLEGPGLCKHRVGLPLKVQLPKGWPQSADVEPGNLHLAVKRPMIKLLSPYVLEFSGDLQVEHLIDDCWQEDKLPPVGGRAMRKHGWQNNVPDDGEPNRRLENKIDHFFLGTAAERKTAPAEGDPGVNSAGGGGHLLPRWEYAPAQKVVDNLVEKPVDSPVEKVSSRVGGWPVENAGGKIVVKKAPTSGPAKDQAKEQIYAPGLNKNRFRAILTAAAISRLKARGEDLTQTAGVVARPDDMRENARNLAKNAQIAKNDRLLNENKTEEVSKILTEENKMVDDVAEENLAAAEVAGETAASVPAAAEVVEVVGDVVPEVVAEVAAGEVPPVENPAVAEGAETPEVAQNQSETVESGDNRTVPVENQSAAENILSNEEGGVQLVNSGGVRVRLSAKQFAPPRQEMAHPVSSAYSIKYYVVKPGDDAMHIALKHNISLEKLREANHLPDGEPTAGTLLRIPG